MKTSVLSLLGVAAAVSAGYGDKSTTSTVYTTSVYTITSCAPTVTDCPERGSVTTDIISLYTTICPVTETETNSKPPPPPTSSEVPYTTSTIYTTTEYTITACPPTVTNCPYGSKTTETYTTTTYCPVSSTYVPPPISTSSGLPPPPSPPSTPSTSPVPPPVLTTVTVSTCVPTVITSIYTVTATPVPVSTPGGYPGCNGGTACIITTKPYSTGTPTGGSYPVGPKNSTVPFTGGAGANKVGGLLMAAGLVAALL